MAYGAKTYTLKEEAAEGGTKYSISFKDGQGEHHELEVSEQLFFEFRQMERRNRNLQQWNQRHREFNEVWDETLYRLLFGKLSAPTFFTLNAPVFQMVWINIQNFCICLRSLFKVSIV